MTSKPRPVPTGRIDFDAADLPEYANCYAIVLDSLYPKAEIITILDAPTQAGKEWDVARVNAGTYEFTNTSYRNGERIIYDSFELSGQIFEKIRPHLSEIEEIEEDVTVRAKNPATGRYKKMPAKQKWRMVRMNERLRFLRYPVGGFFRAHVDGCYENEQNGQRTFYTVQLYLPSDTSGSAQSFKPAGGGATRFWGDNEKDYADVIAVPGRVLVFQHDDLLHTGEEVTSGVKCAMRSDILYEKVGEPMVVV
ncbi:P4Hc domain-containing protein [Mycena indigotica]|uniref:P4Hc domain-containing protein n=1 Tax=Mycena indigotica TaxID=2126181 RepID=A0A8H6RXY7_9AGAR|nr:P4Hc domain-containing protein [Mycena indigotica]KAF7289820.1 P4Hc domain-containing protein [Mycena indigotica]